MKTIDNINQYISEQILLGNKNVVINLSEYTNISSVPIIAIPDEISSITFNQSVSDSTFYKFQLFTDVRSDDLSVFVNNIKVNSESSIAFDLRGYMNADYITYLIFTGSNIIKSLERSGINTASHKIVISGKSQSDKLIVYGGASYESAAIGNSVLSPYGCSIVFEGYGTVEAYGGNGGGEDNTPSGRKGLNGGYGIGFCTSTPSPNSVIITDYINVIAAGGNGQNIQSTDFILYLDTEGGQGGDGISAGICGKIIKSSYGTLISTGGNGGSILDESYGNSGDGGSALIIDGGEINLNSNSTLIGGNGGSGANGGSGGHGIEILNTESSSACQPNYVSIKNNASITSGNGGNGSTGLGEDLNLIGGNGGNGGNIFDLGDSKTILIAEDLDAVIGSGGNGGSPYDQYPDFSDPNAIAGNGGNTGQYINGGQVLNNSNNKTITIMPGTAGNPGRILIDGEIISGTSGSVLDFIEIDVSLKSPIEFDISGFTANLIVSNSRNILINQTLYYDLKVCEIDLQKNYNSFSPIIYGNAVMSLLTNIIINQYENRQVAVYSKKN